MEEVTYFNFDLESQLDQDKYRINFNKFNEQFEYLALFVDNKKLLTRKLYSQTYKQFLRQTFGIYLEETQQNKKTSLFFGDISADAKVAASRLYLNKFTNNGVVIDKASKLKSGYLYKRDMSISGNGNFLYPRDKKKILSLLAEGEELIEEPLFKRQQDYSCLYLDGEYIFYETFIDEFFQFKGVQLGELSIAENLVERHKNLRSLLPDMRTLSIDSFEHSNGSYVGSECNPRIGMGYFAYSIYKKWFSEHKIFNFMIHSKRVEIPKGLQKLCYNISPEENKFQIYLFLAESLEQMAELKARVLKT